MNLKEAAQQALEYLEQHAIISGAPIRDALRAALEPVTTCHELSKEGDKLSLSFNHFPDAGKMVATISKTETVEPVAWIGCLEGGIEYGTYHKAALKLPDGVRFDLYTAPPKREPLTDEEISKIFIYCGRDKETFARAIERAIWEKNGG